MADNTPWKWNYFTLESLSIVKCSLCDNVHTPILVTSKALRQHLEHKHEDKLHTKSFDQNLSSPRLKGFSWDPYYQIISSDKICKPLIQCKHCQVFIPMSSDNKEFIKAPKDLSEHLKNAHKIEYSNWQVLESWIYGRTQIEDMEASKHRIGLLVTNQVIKVNKCTICKDDIGAKNAIMFVKHLIKKHHDDPRLNIPWDIIPKELYKLRPSDVTVREDTTLSSDIADRQGPSSDIADRQGSSGVFTESTQSSSKRKEEVSKEMSELLLDYDPNDPFDDINTDDSQRENIMEIETSISRNQPMAYVLEDGSQIDVQVPSTQPPDPRDISSTLGKHREFSQSEINKLKEAVEYTKRTIEIFKKLQNRSAVSTQIEEPPYKRRKSSCTDDSD